MEKPVPQSFKKHARFVPAFHFFVLPVLLVNAIYHLVLLKNGISFGSIMAALVAISLFVLAGLARSAALAVQDRVICLEMQTRMEKLLPAEFRPRIVEFTPNQLIGLRFASDAELPSLAQQVLDEKIADRKTIKSRVKNWRPDYMRA
jgi:hypothetical protein